MNNLQALTLDSREVAKMLPKRHANLLRDIATYSKYLSDFNELNFALVDFFQESSYQDSKGEKRKCYLITKKGCEFIAHKMTGKKGALFTATYINRFHEMEQALKECQSAAPVPVLKRVTWHGNIVMTAIQFQQLTGINRATMRARAKAEGLRYFLLMAVDAKLFREENKLTDKVGRRIIYPQGSVIMLLKLLGLYQKLKEHIEEYFRIGKYTPKPPVQKVSCNTKPVQEAIEIISEKLLTMNGLLKQIPDYKRKPEEHENIVKIAEELGISVFTELQKLQTQIHTISL